MRKKKKGGIEQSRIHVRQNKNTEVMQFQKKERRHDKRVSLPVILLLVWIGVYFASITFPITYYGIGTGGLHVINWRPAYIMENVSNMLRQSYELLILGKKVEILASYCMFLAIGLAGAALAACGAVFQGAFKNVLAGPSTMGVMSGGSMGAILYLLFLYPVLSARQSGGDVAGRLINANSMTVGAQYAQQFCTLAGCFGGVLLVISVAMIAGKGKLSSSAMVVAGMVFSGVVSNILMIVQYYVLALDAVAGAALVEALQILMNGSFNTTMEPLPVAMMGIPIVVCLIILMILRGKLNLLSLGEDEAVSMGVNVRFYRNLMIVIGTVMTAVVVSFCGRIGFIGFMVPLLVRKLTGPDLKKLLPVSIIAGAIILTVIYDVARLAGHRTDAINMFTSIVGCAVLVVALLRKGGAQNAAKQGPNAAGMGFR